MVKPKKFIHFERSELFVVFVLLALSHGMLFVLGLLTGFGVTPGGSAADLFHRTAATAPGHGRAPASHHEAVKVASSDPEMLEMKKAFDESKKQAFVEASLRKNWVDGPRSLLEEDRFKGGREPASERQMFDSDGGNKDTAVAKAENEAKQNQGNGVSALFERNPASIRTFSPRPGGFTVQIASYSTQDQAQAKVAELRSNGFDEAYMLGIQSKSGGNWYRVLVGSYNDVKWAKKAGERLVRQQFAHDFMIQKTQ